MQDRFLSMAQSERSVLHHSLNDRGMQPNLLPVRISTRYPARPIGKDNTFYCIGVDGKHYYCKDDSNGRPSRANEWVFYSLARHLRILTPQFAILEDDSGNLYFGSEAIISTASRVELDYFFKTPVRNELGQVAPWPGQYFSRLYIFDLFIGNMDRTIQNFVMDANQHPRPLYAIDFADADLSEMATDRFAVAGSNTMIHGRFLRIYHPFSSDSADEMIKNIGAIPPGFLREVMRGMPDDWLAQSQRQEFCEQWASGARHQRLAALRAGIADGSLL